MRKEMKWVEDRGNLIPLRLGGVEQ
jgi:hypothetical protein